MNTVRISKSKLRSYGIEAFRPGLRKVELPKNTVLEAPCGLKWVDYRFSLRMGAFSYQVSGYCFGATIGRYCSMGEEVQIGRQNHPLNWASTSPALYMKERIFDVGNDFEGAEEFHQYKISTRAAPTKPRLTKIGNDVYIGHGAFICAGVAIGDGAIVAGKAVVTKDVPPYALVAGNPATVRKYRIPEHWIIPMLRIRWWRFAPWQLKHLDLSNLPSFVRGVEAMENEKEFAPKVIDFNTYS